MINKILDIASYRNYVKEKKIFLEYFKKYKKFFNFKWNRLEKSLLLFLSRCYYFLFILYPNGIRYTIDKEKHIKVELMLEYYWYSYNYI